MPVNFANIFLFEVLVSDRGRIAWQWKNKWLPEIELYLDPKSVEVEVEARGKMKPGDKSNKREADWCY